MVLIKVYSDNFHAGTFTVEAYEALALSMSTGDYATHTTQLVVMPESAVDFDAVWTLEPASGEILEPAEGVALCNDKLI